MGGGGTGDPWGNKYLNIPFPGGKTISCAVGHADINIMLQNQRYTLKKNWNNFSNIRKFEENQVESRMRGNFLWK
jgi:hypothetical protein